MTWMLKGYCLAQGTSTRGEKEKSGLWECEYDWGTLNAFFKIA
jgi:hypothetical protein